MKFRWVRLGLCLSLLLGYAIVPSAWAAANTCTAVYGPGVVAPNHDTNFSFNLYNGTSKTISYVQLTPPPGYLTLEAGAASGFTVEVLEDMVIFSGGSLLAGRSQGFTVRALSGPTEGDAGSWGVLMADDADMSVTCSGDTHLSIENQASIIAVSSVTVSNVASSSAVVKWNTDIASDSQVLYGATAAYGKSTTLNPALVTNHSVTLTGLTPSQGYHFAVKSATPSDGGSTTSGDNTFLTPAAPIVIVPSDIVYGAGPSGSVPLEKVAPVVSLATNLAVPFKQVPQLAGTASDNAEVARVEYSLDGGKNWQEIEGLVAVRASMAQVSFSFKPLIVDDGDYLVVLRATDTSGNMATSAASKLVLDQLPPRFGASVVMTGPQVILPAADGTLVVSAGVDCRLNISIIGGPVSAAVRAKSGLETGRSFNLTPGTETGVWMGVLSFPEAGRYDLVGEAVDGAGNRTERVLTTIVAVAPVKVAAKPETLKGAVATLYYLNPEDHSWTVWDAGTYGQQNPQALGESKALNLLVPPGKYYLKIALPRRLDTLTRSFELERSTPLTGTVRLEIASFNLGPLKIPLPWTPLEDPPLEAVSAASGTKLAAIGARLPLVKLTTTTGRSVSPVDWYGRPTVVATMATWVPASAEQLAPLAELQKNSDVNVVVVGQQQRAQTVGAYMKIAGSSLEVVADPDGLLSDSLTTSGIPALYFLDRHGIIKKVMVGTQSADEMLIELSRL